MAAPAPRIGIDLGGTKIAGVALDAQGNAVLSRRVATPYGDYPATIEAIGRLVDDMERTLGAQATVGVGMPGSMSPATGRVQNANSVWLNGQRLDRDLAARLGRPVRTANDANCFALSEATDGAGAGTASVFGVILGTGCGGGLVCHGRLIDGPRGIGGEWGHNPLPWAARDELPGPRCWCGKRGCMETWVSGPALAREHRRLAGLPMAVGAEDMAAAAQAGASAARDALERHASRLARGLAMVVNILDPEVIVLGGGLANLGHLYEVLPALMAPYIFADNRAVAIRPPRYGDASGVRGAAWLWNEP